MNRINKWIATGAGIAGASYAGYVASTWLRYGTPRKPRGGAADALLDSFMPRYDVCERHVVEIAAPPEIVLAAAKEMRFADSGVVRAIFRARDVIMRSAESPSPKGGLVDAMLAIGWGILAESPGREIVIGAVTKPWTANPVFRALPPDEFAAFDEPDYVKIAWTLRATAGPDGGSTFRTETRAVATDAKARRKFRIYWSLLSPGIIAIRRMMLPAVKAEAEKRWHVEGDDIVPEPQAQLTHAITIDAPPRDIWPWLLQMGGQRAGWYSWDRLDNGGVRSADRIVPELQQLEVGDVVPARPSGTEGFEVLRIVPERALVLKGMSPDWLGTWAFELEPLGPDRTRLVTRYRAGYPPSLKMALALPVISKLHAFMERKQLRTIKERVEKLHATQH